MKTTASKLTLLVSVFAVFSMFAAPVVRAGDESADAKAQKAAAAKAKHEADVLRKYDKNANGVLDPDEAALRQANVDKMKVLREAKKRKAEERKTSQAAKPAATN